jgi:hypothetical protein
MIASGTKPQLSNVLLQLNSNWLTLCDAIFCAHLLSIKGFSGHEEIAAVENKGLATGEAA